MTKPYRGPRWPRTTLGSGPPGGADASRRDERSLASLGRLTNPRGRDPASSFGAVAGRRRDELGLSEEELIVTRQALDDLRDRIYVLEAAIEDVERDLAAEEPTEQELRDAVQWLLDAARPLVGSDANFT